MKQLMVLSERELFAIAADLKLSLKEANLFELYKLPEPLSDSITSLKKSQAHSMSLVEQKELVGRG